MELLQELESKDQPALVFLGNIAVVGLVRQDPCHLKAIAREIPISEASIFISHLLSQRVHGLFDVQF
jgi:hypothetical protein